MARDVMAIRLDRTARLRLQVAAKRRSLTPSAALRSALDHWLEADERSDAARPYEGIVDLLGSVRGGDRGRSTRKAEWVLAALRGRSLRRRR